MALATSDERALGDNVRVNNRAAYDKWSSLSFPVGSSVDEVDDAHADLAYWDAMTNWAFAPMAHGARYDPGVLDFPTGLTQFRARLVGLRAEAAVPEAGTLDAHVGYVDVLVAVHRLAASS